MSTKEVVFVDLSSIAHPIWHMSQSEPDANHASQQIVARVRALASDKPHVAVCCDSGKSFRHEISSAYKANRPESDAPLQHQITLAREQLEADGFPVWAVRGFEADDLIAAGVAKALAGDTNALIISADKDLLQLVGPRVRAMSVRDGSILDEAAVFAKFGVTPEQMRDYLTLVGDKADNVAGAKGIGEKRAAELLAYNKSIEGIYQHLDANGSDFTPSIATSLREFRSRLAVTRSLISLRRDVDLPFEEIAKERTPKDVETFGMEETDDGHQDAPKAEVSAPATSEPHDPPPTPGGSNGIGALETASGDAHGTPETAIAVREPDLVTPAPAEWERQLDPRSLRDAQTLSKYMYESRLFSAYGTPQAVLSTVMLGRELGLPAMASLRSVHIIEGRHALAASLMVALVLKSGLAEYFDPISFSEKEATYETKRVGGRQPIRLTHTIEMGIQAWPKTKADWQEKFNASGWGKNPTDMLVARACARLARMVYPDLLAGLYTPEELSEIREQAAA